MKGPFKETKRKASYEWIIDSGATVHCVNDFSLLTSVYTDHDPVHIKVADKRVIRASAVGTGSGHGHGDPVNVESGFQLHRMPKNSAPNPRSFSEL